MGSGGSGLFNNTKGGCFTAGTLILTEYGLKPIEEIQIGDYVYSKNIETEEIQFKRVIETFIHTAKETMCIHFGQTKIETTLEHPFWIYEQDWNEAQHIKEGDLLTSKENISVIVEKTEKILYSEQIEVYNFHVEDFHTYYVSEFSILVHNSSKKNNEYKKPASGKSAKEAAKDVPSWAKGERPFKWENGKEFAKRLCDKKYGKDNYPVGAGTEYNKIRKWGDRGFE